VGAEGRVAGLLGQPQGLDEVALGDAVLAVVVGHPAQQVGLLGRGLAQCPPHLVGVRAAQQREDVLVHVLGEYEPAGPSALEDVHALELAEHVPYGGDVFETHPRGGVRGLVEGVEEPVTGRPDSRDGGEGCCCQEASTVHVRSPQVGDGFHRNGERGVVGERELRGAALAQPEVVGGDLVPEARGEDGGEDLRYRRSRPVAGQPAPHRRGIRGDVRLAPFLSCGFDAPRKFLTAHA
jgi:hypothetical protein